MRGGKWIGVVCSAGCPPEFGGVSLPNQIAVPIFGTPLVRGCCYSSCVSPGTVDGGCPDLAAKYMRMLARPLSLSQRRARAEPVSHDLTPASTQPATRCAGSASAVTRRSRATSPCAGRRPRRSSPRVWRSRSLSSGASTFRTTVRGAEARAGSRRQSFHGRHSGMPGGLQLGIGDAFPRVARRAHG